MKYFIDTEFHEYSKKPLFGKPIDTIELISIGIVSEDIPIKQCNIEGDGYEIKGNTIKREYYAVCKEFDLKAAWDNEWLRDNVLINICIELADKYEYGSRKPIYSDKWTYGDLKYYINKYGKTRKQIADEIKKFVHSAEMSEAKIDVSYKEYKPEFYAYYADYDWVVFCWLFGGKFNLPKGFPHLFHELAELEISKRKLVKGLLKEHLNYPKNNNAHNALSDAKWNYELYKFLQTINN